MAAASTPGPSPRRVFLSYARKDGTAAAQSLQAILETAKYDVFFDTARISGGASWSTVIEDALNNCHVLIAILTPASYLSEICRAEHIWALDKHKLVIPVLANPDAEIPLYLKLLNYRKFPDQQSDLLNDLGVEAITTPPSARPLGTLAGHSDLVLGVALSADSKRAVSASRDKTLKVWDVESGREVRTLAGHLSVVNGVALSADGKRAVSASSDKTLKVWDVDSGREMRTLAGHSSYVLTVAPSADGKRALSTSLDKTLKVWEVDSGREVRTLAGHFADAYRVALSAGGKLAVSASLDKTLKVWEVESGREVRTLAGHSSHVRKVALNADGKQVASVSIDNTLKLWDVESGAFIATFHSDAAATCCAFIDEHRILVGDAAGHLHLLQLIQPRP